ncbi:MAG: RNA polymerase sigma factor [Clostridia bacterium]|nr:RNA polymerase sigma factor [Clostridia bacterium]
MEERRFTLKLLESEQMLYRIACAFLRSEADRRDTMQETALKAWQYRDRLREEQYFRTWITRIMVNECRIICRKSRRMIVAETLPDQAAPEDHDLEMRLMLESLPEKQRVPLVLHYLEGFSLEEISQVLHVSVGIVKYRMHQARKKLRVEWNGKEETL